MAIAASRTCLAATILATATCSFFTQSAVGQIIYVDQNATGPIHDGTSWCTAYLTLDAGLAAASSGTTIRLADGIYTPDPSGLPDVRQATFKLKSGVRVEGCYAGCGAPNPDERSTNPADTYLRGDPLNDDDTTGDLTNNSYHVVTAGYISSAVLDRMYIHHGFASDGHVSNGTIGAGLFATRSSIQLTDVVFKDNWAQIDVNSNVGRGGGIYESGSGISLTNCVFHENTSGEAGGAIYMDGGKVQIRGGAVALSVAHIAGGGIYNYGGSVLVSRCLMGGGYADNGGTVYTYKGTVSLANCLLHSATAGNGAGGALYSIGSVCQLVNCDISGNSAGTFGGGVYSKDSKLHLNNCTATLNGAGSVGGGVYIAGTGGGADVSNSIFWTNTANSAGGEPGQVGSDIVSALGINYCDVEGWTGLYGGLGNFGLDPLLVGSHVSPGSPCLNAGSNAYIPNDFADLDGDGNTLEQTPFDLDDEPRIQSHVVDMGAYEDL